MRDVRVLRADGAPAAGSATAAATTELNIKEKKKTNLSSQPKKLQFLDFLFCVSAEIGNSCGRLPPQAKVITMPDDGECYLW